MMRIIVLCCPFLILMAPPAFSESIIHSAPLKCKAHFSSAKLDKAYDFEMTYTLNIETGVLKAEKVSADSENSRVLKYAHLPATEPLSSQNSVLTGVAFLASPHSSGHNLLSPIFRQAIVQIDTYKKESDTLLHWQTTFKPFANGAVGFFAANRDIDISFKDQSLSMQITGRDYYDQEAVRTKSTSYAPITEATTTFDEYRVSARCMP